VTGSAITLSFHDTAHELHGTVRSGMTLLFDAGAPSTVDVEATFERSGDGWTAAVGDALTLTFTASSPGVDLGGASTWVGRATGRVGSRALDCIGVATETVDPPSWSELDALRSVAAVFDEGNAVLALARRPRGSYGHGEELVRGWIRRDGEPLAIEEARISTVYDGDGRQRKAGLELWMPGEDFPRRASGSARAGASITLEGLRVHAAVFDWRMEGRDGIGGYDIVVREQQPAAA
jgi:hypothetical protein